MTMIQLHVGTYASGGGRGLYPLAYDTDGGFRLGEPYAEAGNASFGAASARHGLHYLVNEQAMGALGAYRRDGGHWHRVKELPTDGREPCYVALDPAEQRLAVANYGSGSVRLLALDDRGIPQAGGTSWANGGSGPDPDRQEGPHLHCVRFSPDGRWLYAVDLGTDQILRFAVDDGTTLGAPEVVFRAPPGSGPRHFLFHPGRPMALLVSELASTLSLFDVTGQGLSMRLRCSTVPGGFGGENLGGHLAINAAGDRIYVSNRGHDSIVVFALGEHGGLDLLQHVSSGGASPRHFLLLEDAGRLLLVNEEGANIVAFALRGDGTLRPTGAAIAVPAPAFLLR